MKGNVTQMAENMVKFSNGKLKIVNHVVDKSDPKNMPMEEFLVLDDKPLGKSLPTYNMQNTLNPQQVFLDVLEEIVKPLFAEETKAYIIGLEYMKRNSGFSGQQQEIVVSEFARMQNLAARFV